MASSDNHYRPQYHFSPPANWLNDPNGLVYYQGEYHLLYQYHPDSPVWGPMHWGHAVSRDLVNWQHLPIALYPDEYGLIYSGSAVIDRDNSAGFGKEAMVAIFTHHQEGHESQSLAYSTDRGRTWTKYPGNPVLLPPESQHDFRDPKVFWYGELGSGYWVLVLAAGEEIHFYASPDLIHWKSTGRFGKDQIANFGFWETPDLFKLSVGEGPESRWVLTAGVGRNGIAGTSGMRYFIGDFDGETFKSENSTDTVLWVDYGADFYAAQSWNDEPRGLRLMLGWQNNWQYATVIPTTAWRGVLSLPRRLSLKPTVNGIKLFQQPIPELTILRGPHSHWHNITLLPTANLLQTVKCELFEICAEFQINPAVESFGLRVRVGDHQATTIGYNVQQRKIFVDRTSSGQSSFNPGFARVHFTELASIDGIIRLQIFVDRSSVEVFCNDGVVVISDSIFPDEESHRMELFTEGGETIITMLDVYELRPASFTLAENNTQN
jgi:fructan beta-fructosidase